jgi:hypothetical protein
VTVPLTLTASLERAFGRLAADLQRVLGSRFVALIAYQQNASVAFASSVLADDLDALGPLVGAWHHDGLATPLVMTPDEFHRSLDAFPFEYQAILDRHAVIAGTPPFLGVSVDTADLRRACEIQARGHLIHLRQGWIQSGGHQSHLIDVLVRSATPFRALLSHVASLHSAPHETEADLATFAQEVIGIPSDVVAHILDLDTHPERGRKTLSYLSGYLAAAARLWDFVDNWRRT